MANRHQFMQWLQEIDPDVTFDNVDGRVLFITPSDDSPLLDKEAIFDVDSSEMFQFLAGYASEFSCMWQYKNTELWRVGDVWGLSHTFPNKTALQLDLVDASTDLDLFNFIILLNDLILPFERIDDSPVKPKSDNPYRIAMSFVNNGYYNPLNPLTIGSPFAWMSEVKSTADEERDMFLGEDVDFDDYDWEQAYTDAFDEVKAWFWGIKNNPTTAQLEDAIQWLKDCDSGLEIIRDLEETLGELMTEAERIEFSGIEGEQEIDVEREGKQ